MVGIIFISTRFFLFNILSEIPGLKNLKMLCSLLGSDGRFGGKQASECRIQAFHIRTVEGRVGQTGKVGSG